jgi:hypothetical protein
MKYDAKVSGYLTSDKNHGRIIGYKKTDKGCELFE